MTADLRITLLDLIGTGIAAHPRSLQRTVGPSDIANQCDVCLLRALDGSKGQHTAVSAPTDDGWVQMTGTAMHMWLEQAVRLYGGADYLAEQRIRVGHVLDVLVQGSSDVFHLPTRTVVDWKQVGPGTLKQAKSKTAHAPSGRKRGYAVQVQLYGRGYENAGLTVDRVCIAYLPRGGVLRDAVIWSEPYDRDVAHDALDRAARLLTTLRASGLDVALSSVQADPHCYQCSTTSPRAAHSLAGAVLDDAPSPPNPADLSSAVL